MLVQALLAGLVVGLSKMEYFFGYSMFNRPIVEGALMGLVLGDPVTGTIIGATLEIVFLGSFPVGAAVSPDGGTAAGVSTAFAILTGAGAAVGTAFAVPLALLGGFAFVLCKFINNAFAEAMKAQLAKDNDKAARALGWHLWPLLPDRLPFRLLRKHRAGVCGLRYPHRCDQRPGIWR